ncbi:MAG: sensor histidine kinase [Acetatifactor sp.]|nr:sensor histidine kinase [Acetatifactor sp.]
MSLWISLLNSVAVSIFGSILSASFCNVLAIRRNRCFFAGSMALLLLLQGWMAVWRGAVFVRNIYPLIIHLPLALVLCILTRRWLWPVISVLTAYSCCQLRRWVALLAVAMFSGESLMQDVVELIVTIPLLLLLLCFVTPAVRQISGRSAKVQLIFGVIPALYYGFDYLTSVYTNLLQSGNPAAVEFMPFVCCMAYLVFILYHSTKKQTEIQLQQIQKSLDLQLTQAVREIDTLRESQAMASRYRHDLRHHLQYLAACLENGHTDQAQNYIIGICEEINSQNVRRYCENEAANLILSAFAGRAERAGISMNVQGALPAFILVSDSDLCVLLSNALENAINACQPMALAGTPCDIDVQVYDRNGKLFLQVTNPCRNTVRFEQGVPVSDRPGHGIGVQSICTIVKQYGGIYAFSVRDGRFVLRLSL